MAGMQMMLLGAGGNPFAPLSVTAFNALGQRAGAGVATTFAGETETTPSGGMAPYTTSWSLVSGSTIPAINNASAQNPQWSGTLGAADEQIAIWRVTVTDALSATATADITVTLTNL